MGIIILLIIMALIVAVATGLAIFGPKADRNSDDVPVRGIAAIVAAVVGVLGILVLLFSMATTVGPSDIGVETAFGKTVGDLTPGFHLIPPQNSVAIWSGSVQTITYGRDTNQAKSDHCLLVRIGGQQSACLALTFQYQIRPNAADSLFRLYRSQGNMNDKLVLRSLDQAANEQLANFSPVEAASACGTATVCPGESLVPFAHKITAQMRSDIGGNIVVRSLFIPYVAYDPTLTARLNSIQNQRADTIIANLQVLTNQKLAAANRALATSVSKDPNVIIANCVNQVLIPIVKAGQIPPPGLCNLTGGGSNTVVVPK